MDDPPVGSGSNAGVSDLIETPVVGLPMIWLANGYPKVHLDNGVLVMNEQGDLPVDGMRSTPVRSPQTISDGSGLV